MIETKITIDSLAKTISGKIIGANDFNSPNGFTGIFNILKDSSEGDIVIRHWIDEKGVEIAKEKDIACIITENPRNNSIAMAESLNFPLIIVEKIEEANAVALNWTIKNFSPNSKKLIISGTNGKSTTSHMIYHILKSTGARTLTNTDSKSEFNTLIDPMVPKLISEEVLSKNSELDYIVIEASEVQGWLGKLMKDHAYLMTKAVDPDVAIITNIAMDHIGLVNSIEEVFQETSGVAKAINKGTIVLNGDDELVLAMDEFLDKSVDKFYFSINNHNNNLNDDDISENTFDLKFESNKGVIVYNNNEILKINELPFKSNHFIQNTLAAISACISLDIPIDKIVNGVKSYKSLKRRFKSINDNPLIIDDFAHNPEGIKATINAVSEIANEKCVSNINNGFPKCINIICAIRGSRGEKINKINSETIAETIGSLNCGKFNKISNKEINKNNSNDKNSHKSININTNIILSSSCDVVDEANFVEEFEEKIFFEVLKKENIKFIHYKKLQDALNETYKITGQNDIILLIGAQGMDPAEKILKNIININIT